MLVKANRIFLDGNAVSSECSQTSLRWFYLHIYYRITTCKVRFANIVWTDLFTYKGQSGLPCDSVIGTIILQGRSASILCF